jgi:hypothetical protein
VVGKPLTTVLVPPCILEWSDTRVDENLTDRVLCFLKLQLLLVGLLIRISEAGAASTSSTSVECPMRLHLTDMAVGLAASFISAAYVQTTEGVQMWVLGVPGQIYKAIFGHRHNTLDLERVHSSDLDNQHFVKVDNLFYYFRVSNLGASVEQSILTYLPHYESLRTSTTVHLQAVYSVVVIPSKRLY